MPTGLQTVHSAVSETDLTVWSPLVPLWSEESRAGARPLWAASPGAPLTVVEVVHSVVVEVFSESLDGKPDDDGRYYYDDSHDDDDRKVEEVTAVIIFDAGSPLLDVRQHVTFDHF